MKSHQFISCLFAGMFLSVAPVQAQSTHDKWVNAKDLDTTTAESDAATDFSQGHCRLYAIVGAPGWIVPYAELSVQEAQKKYEIVYVRGVTDHVKQSDYEAREFVRIYNQAAVKNCGVVK